MNGRVTSRSLRLVRFCTHNYGLNRSLIYRSMSTGDSSAGDSITYAPEPSQVSEFYKKLFKTDNYFESDELNLQLLTHKSFNHGQTPYNEGFRAIGRHALELSLINFSLQQTNQLKGVSEMWLQNACRPENINKVAEQWGLQQVIRWKTPKLRASVDTKQSGLERVTFDTMLAIIGAVYMRKGARTAVDFCQKNLVPALIRLLHNTPRKQS
ncbi:ribosomal protein subunit L15 [Schizosaccharomyces japonicus yFS275]|uniref:Ribosomal protein subunit L15 n=1 Tax=Schizosaccharomyces japonicus (strain yFS275 / FY16936) TaxID=402676 RepID=B6JY03_SCHJY|nr:ribosomal protein subunit L15 [Schizosaccharomyces japonicus yFS275]EEB06421.2 ribosomal protein subunit L15 [Schizosaccharomyces japonicus yFS275]